jgi:acetyl-CoA carboxylase alpha subunit
MCLYVVVVVVVVVVVFIGRGAVCGTIDAADVVSNIAVDVLYICAGMPSPHGYRTALRLMQLAEKFQLPVVRIFA